MYFDFLENVSLPGNNGKVFGGASELLAFCNDAERNSRIDPDKSVIAIRQALEVFVSSLLCEYGKSEFSRNDSLSTMISELKQEKFRRFITLKDIDELHELRKIGNTFVHVEKMVNSPTQYTVQGRHAKVEDSSKAVLKLYSVMCSIFKEEKKNITEADLPIEDYEVVRKYTRRKYEAITGQFKYLVKKKGSLTSTYSYIRAFSKEDCKNANFDERDMAVQELFKNITNSQYIISGEEIHVGDFSDIRYLRYNVKENTRTLDQALPKMEKIDWLNVIKDVTQGLIDLKQGNVQIHHRSIRPTCIFVDSFEGKYSGKIGCFETAKIDMKNSKAPVETVQRDWYRINNGSCYFHRQLQENRQISNEEWEKGDVYSLMVVIGYCIDSEGVNNGMIDYGVLSENLSDTLAERIINALALEQLEFVPTLDEFKEMILEEIDNE